LAPRTSHAPIATARNIGTPTPIPTPTPIFQCSEFGFELGVELVGLVVELIVDDEEPVIDPDEEIEFVALC